MIRTLHERVDAFFRDAHDARPSAFACREGCTMCCRVDLSVFPVEAARVREAFRALDPAVRQAAAQRAAAGRHCAMLDDAGRCIVYDARPVICRSHGLAVLVDGRLDPCPLNYRDGPPDRRHVLDLDRLNGALVALDLAAGGRGERVRLADLAGDQAPGREG